MILDSVRRRILSAIGQRSSKTALSSSVVPWTRWFPLTLGLVCWMGVHPAAAQITNVVFSDDFQNGIIDPSVYQPDAPFFEGGKGNISAAEANGVMEFTGRVSQQWWAGGTLRLVQGFSVSDETNLVVSVDRVRETGVGSASRSALWIMDSTTNNFVLFADVRGEGGWRYNRKIGQAGDVPTGSGTDIASMNGGSFDNGLLHRMKVVANGKNVRLYLDDVFGAEVKFPFKDIIIQFGSYARANNDTAHTIFDNLRVETVGKAAFSQTKLALTIGQSSSAVSVRIPLGANATTPVLLRVTSSDPAAVNAVGAVGGTLALVFEAGGSNTKTLNLQAIGGSGGARFTLANDIGLEIANALDVVVIKGPGVRLADNFTSGALDPAKWVFSDEGYEGGAGFYGELFPGGTVEIAGDTQVPLWGGGALKTVDSFVATEDLTLSVAVDRVNMDITQSAQPPVAARTGILLTTTDGLNSIFFSQSLGESGWQVNLKPGTNNIPIPAFASVIDTGNHRMKVVANGEMAQVYLDGQLGGSFPFPVSSGIFVKIGAFGREVGDYISGRFDNVLIENALPCVTASASDLSVVVGQSGSTVTVTIPRLLTANNAASVTVTSAHPGVAVPTGATGGSLTLNFAAGGSLVRTFDVTGVGVGQTTLSFSSAGVCVANNIAVTVTTVPAVLLSDDFGAAEYDISQWVLDSTPLGTGTATPQSAITLENGNAKIVVIGDTTGWPGLALATVDSYAAELASPVTFEIDRVQLGFTLVTGTGAKQRTGIWITDATGANYVFFSEYATHDGAIGGWQYHRSIGQPGDNPVTVNDTIDGVLMAAFAETQFNNRGNHRMKAVANGTTVRLLVDGVLGAEVPFPFADGIKFRFGAYVRAGTDIVTGRFDNARVLGKSPVGALSISRAANGGVTISWDNPGVLQSAGVLGDPNAWSDVNPAPAGNSLTVSAAQQQGTTKFYRLRLP